MQAQHLEKEEEERRSRQDSRATSPDSGYNRNDPDDHGYDNRAFDTRADNNSESNQNTGLSNLEGTQRNGRVRQRQLSNPATNGIAETPT